MRSFPTNRDAIELAAELLPRLLGRVNRDVHGRELPVSDREAIGLALDIAIDFFVEAQGLGDPDAPLGIVSTEALAPADPSTAIPGATTLQPGTLPIDPPTAPATPAALNPESIAPPPPPPELQANVAAVPPPAVKTKKS